MEAEKGMIEVVKSTPKILELIYGDLAQPGVRKVGTALSTVLDLSNTILLPIKLLNEKARLNFKKHMDNYEKKLSEVEEDKVMDVPPEIGMPILEKLTYTTNEEIADLFTNLLHKASSTDTINLAHPSFVDFIGRISVDEANLIKFLQGKRDIPCVSLRAYLKGQKGFQTIAKNETGIANKIKLDFPQNVNVYIDNFCSMGILSPANGLHKIDDNYYKDVISKLEPIRLGLEKSGLFEKTDFNKTYYDITSFGQQFMRACTYKKQDKTT